MSGELPIHAVRTVLEAALAEPRPIVVTAPTGSGKSTCLPRWIASTCGGRVLVVEPRRVACRALALFLARERGESVGETIGYRVRFDEQVGPNTRVCFVTPGVALNLAAAGRLTRDEHAALMLDEFHERSWELDLLVALVRRSSVDAPRLIVCSATLAVDHLVAQLGARAITAEGRSFPVEIEHAGDGPPSERDLDVRVAAAVERALARSAEGDVLVFLPGKGEIDRCAGTIEAALDRGAGVELIAVHGGVPPGELLAAFAPASRRRVFLATNVAESSLTLPGVRTVIDSGLARMRMHRGGRSILALAIVARDSMDQRAGRAGRVAPGRCVRLWSPSFVARETTAPELERIELDELILRAAACGLDADALDGAAWIDPPPGFALDAARDRLARVGAIDARGRVSAHGLQLARLPVAGERARMLLDAPAQLAGSVADLVALLEHRRSPWLASASPEAEAARAELTAALGPGIRDEVHATLLAVRRGHPRRHALHPSGLAEIRRLAESLRELVGAPRLSTDRDAPLPDPGALARFLIDRVPEAAFVRRPRADRDRDRDRGRGRRREGAPWANGEIELSVRDPSVPGLAADDHDPAPRAGLILDHEWIGVGRSARGRGRMLLPCSPELLAAHDLGELELREPKIEIRGGGVRSIAATVERKLAGATLETHARELDGPALRSTVAALLLDGRKLPPLGRALPDAILDELHLWTIVRSVIEGPLAGRVPAIPEPPEPAAWIEARLAALGLETAEDLALLSDADLRPVPAALAELAAPLALLGEREWTLDALASDFPRIWIDRDARYHCGVRLDRRRVIVEPADALARKRGEPRPELLPRFRGFSVVFLQASRRVVLR